MYKTGFWVEVTFDSWVRRTNFKETIKKWIFPKVDFIVTVGRDGRDFAMIYGVPQKRIFFAPHCIDVSHFRNGNARVRLERPLLREKLCVDATTFLYVGRLVRQKGLGYLLNAFKEVQIRSQSEVHLILVGDGADEKLFQHKCKAENIRNVIFTGFRQKDDLPDMYALADVFVFPTLGDPYGLVVDEAMACSLPVITTSAAGEIRDRVEDGKNGYIVPPENSHALAEAMLKLSIDTKLRQRMGSLSAKKIARRTPEKWAQDFERIILCMLSR